MRNVITKILSMSTPVSPVNFFGCIRHRVRGERFFCWAFALLDDRIESALGMDAKKPRAMRERAECTKFQLKIFLQKYNYVRLAYIYDAPIDPHRRAPQPCYRRTAEAPSFTNTN